ncbi:MAG: Glutamine-dependent NAD(+) synthetase [Chlamydiales bacterium]|nr:Glutamine-dependent NAD(+) synthetase [Chlamydiales bacterium]
MLVALAQINPTVGALSLNCQKILLSIEQARSSGAELIVFPEMALSGYPPEDLLLLPSFIEAMTEELKKVIVASKGMIVIVGTVRENLSGGEKGLYNTAAILDDGKLVGFQDKTLLPDYDVFDERRYFEPAARTDVWSVGGKRIAVTICEDIWQHTGAVEYTSYQRDPVQELAEQAPDFLVNLSASPYYLQRHETRLHVCVQTAQTIGCPVLFCNQIGGNDSLIFDGCSLHLNASGQLIQYAKGFEEDLLVVDLQKEYPPCPIPVDPLEDLFKGLVLGVRDYFHKQGFSKACFGLSGGIDSAVVACIAKEALGAENVHALLLPSRYSTNQGVEEAESLARRLGITFEQLSIEKPFQSFLDLLTPRFEGKEADVTEENLQARVRGIILMAYANKLGYLLLGTGNKSEMAMGFTTLYGDMCGGLGVLNDVSKQQVYALARWINRDQELIPYTTIEKPPSAELRPGQKDSDSLPEYPLVDLVLTEYVEEHLSPEKIAEKHHLPLHLVKELVRKIHINEYKRQQAPPGLRVTKRAFTVGRRFPIVQQWNV